MSRFKEYLEGDVVSLPKTKIKRKLNLPQDTDDRKLFQNFVNKFFALLDEFELTNANKDLAQLFLNEMFGRFKKK